jgi:hypothetical protein
MGHDACTCTCQKLGVARVTVHTCAGHLKGKITGKASCGTQLDHNVKGALVYLNKTGALEQNWRSIYSHLQRNNEP